MIFKNVRFFSFVFFLGIGSVLSQQTMQDNILVTDTNSIVYNDSITLGAEQYDAYLPKLKGKRVAIVANQTTVVNNGNEHLVDVLLNKGVTIVNVFSPEHGFRGKASAGEKVNSSIDDKTGLPIVSLYGKHKKPTKADLKDIDILIFDLQDVGARFYTYISTMHYVMEVCAEQKKELIVLDRPNPNGFYVDGPILEKQFKSFVGMHPIPVVHGLTVGELANMINEEGWIKPKLKQLDVVKCLNYSHKDLYKLPVAPSPNLPNMASVYLYPSLCFFEGTSISVGRGTDKPFQIFGSPDVDSGTYNFMPKAKVGAMSPKHENKTCIGYDVSVFGKYYMKDIKELYLFWICSLYESSSNKEDFINRASFFDLLAGTDKLRKGIEKGLNPKELKETWSADLVEYQKMRKQYLLYEDY